MIVLSSLVLLEENSDWYNSDVNHRGIAAKNVHPCSGGVGQVS